MMSYTEIIKNLKYTVALEKPYTIPADLMITWVVVNKGKVAYIDRKIFNYSGYQVRREIQNIAEELDPHNAFTTISGELECQDLVVGILPENNPNFSVLFHNICLVINRYKELGNVCRTVSIVLPKNDYEVYNQMLEVFSKQLKDIEIIISANEDEINYKLIRDYLFFKRDKKTFSNKIEKLLLWINSIINKR